MTIYGITRIELSLGEHIEAYFVEFDEPQSMTLVKVGIAINHHLQMNSIMQNDSSVITLRRGKDVVLSFPVGELLALQRAETVYDGMMTFHG